RLCARPAAAAVLVPLCSVRWVPARLYTQQSSRLSGSRKGDVSKRPAWCQCLPAWAHWIPRVSGLTRKRWMRYLPCPWPTCCRHRTKGIPTSAGVAISATHCLSSCTSPTVSGGSRPSSLSSPCSCWPLAPTSPAWPARRGP
ncbi:unnamed protein product, partial [Gulo gulo]